MKKAITLKGRFSSIKTKIFQDFACLFTMYKNAIRVNHDIMDKLDNHYLKWRIITNVKTWKGLFIIFGSMKYWDLIGIGESNNCRYV